MLFLFGILLCSRLNVDYSLVPFSQVTLFQGFKALQGSTGAAGPRLFTIHQVDAPTNNLPKAHTWCVGFKAHTSAQL